jgi:hypothetical protein
MHNGSITSNTASSHGGGIANISEGVLNIHNGNVYENKSTQDGGGIFNFGTLNIFDGKISNNTAARYGGGVANQKLFNMHNGLINENISMSDGGGISNAGSEAIFNMFEGTLSANNAARWGGGVFNFGTNSTTFDMFGGEIHNNHAISQGGGITNMAATFQISDGIIYGIDVELKSNTSSGSATLANANNAGIPFVSQHGTFSDSIFSSIGSLSATSLTIEIINGIIIQPPSVSIIYFEHSFLSIQEEFILSSDVPIPTKWDLQVRLRRYTRKTITRLY